MMTSFPKLKADDIEVKFQQVGEKGAVALLYKTARTDMRLLDETVGAMYWQDSYREIKGNLYCSISIWDEEKKQWISKEDCGIESRDDEAGNQKKGEASDAFKRAGTKWGIGRELYTSPFVFLKIPTIKEGSGYKPADKYEKYDVKQIEYDGDRISKLVIVDSKDIVVYSFGGASKEKTPRPQSDSKLLEGTPLEESAKKGEPIKISANQVEALYKIAEEKGYSKDAIADSWKKKNKGTLIEDIPLSNFKFAQSIFENLPPKKQHA